MTAIFISHRSSDNAVAQKLKRWLAAEGHEQLFLDFDPADGIPAGVDWEQRLYKELRRCQAVLIVLTPAWLDSKWCSNELAIAREKGKAVFVARMSPCPSGSLVPAIQEVDLTVDWNGGLEKLARGLKEHGLDPRDAFDWKSDRPVYPGLSAFDVEDAAIFFGRSEETWTAIEALRRLRIQPTGSRKLLLITGASGSGKSSLMRAGVLARLRKESHHWIVARPFRKGSNALRSLGEALAWAYPEAKRPSDPSALAQRLLGERGRVELSLISQELRFAWNRPEATLVLPIDQGEELISSGSAEYDSAFLDLLREALTEAERDLIAIATIRSDTLAEWQAHPSIQAGRDRPGLLFEPLPLGPMPMDRVPKLARGPAKFIELRIDDNLVAALSDDTATPDALPLLAYTLQQLQLRYGNDGRLTLEEYKSLGGLEGSVRTIAREAIREDQLTRDDLAALHAAFVPSMVCSTEIGSFVRRPALRHDVPRLAEPLIQRLIDARLLKTDVNAKGEETIEIAHEALLRVWPLLAGWIAEDLDKLRALEGLRRAAEEWDRKQQRPDLIVHREQRLTETEALVLDPRFAKTVGATDRLYLGASREAERRRLTDAEATQKRELEAAQRLAEEQQAKARRTRVGLAVASVLAIVAAALGYWGLNRAKEAEVQTATATRSEGQAKQERDRGRMRLLAIQARRAESGADTPEDIERAGALALESIELARKVGYPAEADAIEVCRSALIRLPLFIFQHGSAVSSLSVLVDGRLASAGHDSKIKLWPKDGRDQPTIIEHGSLVRSLAGLADGRLASAGDDGEIKLWSKDGQGQPAILQHGSPVSSLLGLADGRLASGGEDGKIKLWPKDAQGQPAVLEHRGPVRSLLGLADGRLASSGDGGGIKLWAKNGSKQYTDVVSADRIDAFVELPDGGLAYAAYHFTLSGGSVEIQVRDKEGNINTLEYLERTNKIRALAALADGRVASADNYNWVKLWPKYGQGQPTILHQSGPTSSLVILPDQRLASGGDDGKIRIWPKDGQGEPVILEHAYTVWSLAGLPDGRLASIGDSGHGAGREVLVWPKDGQGKPTILAETASIWSLTALTDGRLASGDFAGEIKLWPKDGQGQPVIVQQRGLKQQGLLRSLAGLADGRLAIGSDDGKIKILPKDGRGQPVILNHGTPVQSLAALVDGRVASGGDDSKIKLWPKDGRGQPAIIEHGGLVRSLAGLADGRLASGGSDSKIKLWPKDGQGQPVILDHGSLVRSLAGLADGRLASGGDGGKIKLWLVDEEKLISALCLRAGRNLSKDEWAYYIGSDTPWQPSCRNRPSTWRTPGP
jgi:WD40 repeat protein